MIKSDTEALFIELEELLDQVDDRRRHPNMTLKIRQLTSRVMTHEEFKSVNHPFHDRAFKVLVSVATYKDHIQKEAIKKLVEFARTATPEELTTILEIIEKAHSLTNKTREGYSHAQFIAQQYRLAIDNYELCHGAVPYENVEHAYDFLHALYDRAFDMGQPNYNAAASAMIGLGNAARANYRIIDQVLKSYLDIFKNGNIQANEPGVFHEFNIISALAKSMGKLITSVEQQNEFSDQVDANARSRKIVMLLTLIAEYNNPLVKRDLADTLGKVRGFDPIDKFVTMVLTELSMDGDSVIVAKAATEALLAREQLEIKYTEGPFDPTILISGQRSALALIQDPMTRKFSHA